MRVIPSNELVELIGLFVTLMIFFSLDAKFRFSPNIKHHKNQEFFKISSIVGGLATVIAAISVWVEFFLPREDGTLMLLFILIPGSIAFLAALFLALDVLFLRFRKDPPALE
ncbi:MAG: hypothetical protein WBA28_06250 [Microbacteriaceae bacterium]